MMLLAAIVLNALWQDALLVVMVWLLLRVLSRANAATRYVVWSAALAAAIVVPIVTTYVSLVPARTATVAARVAPFDPARQAAPLISSIPRRTTGSVPKRWAELPQRLKLTIPVNVARAVVAAWAVLAGYALLGLLIGLWRLERLKRDALPLPIEYRDAMPQWSAANKGRRAVRLCVSDQIDVPVAAGLFDSMILVPRDLLERLSPSEVEQISLHELAHLRRGDDWTNCAQRLVVAALGWNPAAIFIAQQLELEREVACDDWVLSSVQSVRPYAMCLTKMAQTAAWPHHPMPAPGVFTTRKQISLRIERLLASGRDIATTLSVGPAIAAVTGVAAAAVVIATVAPSIAAPAVAPIAPATPIAHSVTHVKTIERVKTVVRIVHVTPAAVATPMRRARPVAVAATAEKMAMDMARTAIAEIPSLPRADDFSSRPSRSCSGCEYEGVNWAGRDLRGARYTGVDFVRANLSSVNLSESKISGTDFTRANLTSASFRRAHLEGCDFTQATLAGADFSGAVLNGCTFDDARLDGANFDGARLVDCDLDSIDPHRVDLSHAQIIDTDSLKQPSPP